jgi:prepilin-type N-terminal cleavage/methylation domain-containing protein
MPRRHLAELGYTLIEALVTMAVLGIITLIVVTHLNGMYRRFELEGSALQLRSFLESVPDWAKERNTRVFLIWDPDASAITIAADVAGNEVLDELGVPAYLVLAPDQAQTFECDTMGRAFAAGAPMMLNTPQVMTVTHTAMTSGVVSPHIEYRMTLTPLWHVASEKRLL